MTTMNKPAAQSPARRNWQLAALLAIVAIAFYVGFFFAVSHRG